MSGVRVEVMGRSLLCLVCKSYATLGAPCSMTPVSASDVFGGYECMRVLPFFIRCFVNNEAIKKKENAGRSLVYIKEEYRQGCLQSLASGRRACSGF